MTATHGQILKAMILKGWPKFSSGKGKYSTFYSGNELKWNQQSVGPEIGSEAQKIFTIRSAGYFPVDI